MAAAGYRLRAVLVIIAVVPLLGAGWFATNEVVAAREERQRVEDVNVAVRRLVALSELRTRLLDERNWLAAAGGMEQLGLTPVLVQGLTGIDVPQEAVQATEQVDDLIEAQGLDDASERLAEIRADTEVPLTETGRRYDALEQDIGRQSDELLEEVLRDASGVRDRGALTLRIQTLEAATVARQAVSSEFNHYFGAQFSDLADRADELTSLMAQDTIRNEALVELDRITQDGTQSRDAVDEIVVSADAVIFNQAVAMLIEDSITGNGTDAALTAVVSDLQGVAAIFEASSETTDLYFQLVDAAGADMDAASNSANAAAQGRHRRALASLAALVVISFLIAVAATRAIARPIHRLAIAARQISDGGFAPNMNTESGPVEVRDAARAINAASSHLELAARQALALAEGDLEHTSLREPSTGSFGASLQTAVRTLAESLQKQEQLRQQMSYEATHDGLTQLANRTASLEQLNQGLSRSDTSGHRLAVFFIDLDGFKAVNDRHGHHAGDVVLQVTAERLVASGGEGEHIGRLGGDEFLIIAEPVSGEREALELAERIHQTILEPIRIDNHAVAIGASIGVAVSSGDTIDADDLLRDADLALYQAKELGRDRIELCDGELKAAVAERASLEHAIRVGLMDDEFVLYYQPIVEPRTERVVGYEALIRWTRPGYGLVPPDVFIPFAERSDLIVAIDRWVVRNVAKQIVAWDAAGRQAPVPVSINISGRSLSAPSVVANVVGPMDEYGIDASRIVIEVTESAVLDDLTTVAVKLQQLRERGIRIAIDDFGTGYTSLAHLKSLPVDILKIDRSFTSDESAVSLVQLIIDTGHLLGATVTAEGVETREQAEMLSAMGSDDLQGFLFGRPKPAAELMPSPPELLDSGTDPSTG